jgi:uncharacterized protein YfiM (DUF2279 family)
MGSGVTVKWALVFTFTLGSSQDRRPDEWFAVDKWQHFVVSAVVQGVGYGFASGRNGHAASLRIGAGTAIAVGVGKELADRARGRSFSVRDLVWDGAGTGAAALALHGVR